MIHLNLGVGEAPQNVRDAKTSDKPDKDEAKTTRFKLASIRHMSRRPLFLSQVHLHCWEWPRRRGTSTKAPGLPC